MADSYFTQASNYAKQAADAYKSTFDSTLDDLLKTNALQREQAQNNYNNLVNQINANRETLRQSYRTNARQAYVNKLLADQQTTDTLSRMNLNQSGFRLTQDTLTNNRYDASLNALALAQDKGLRDLDTQQLNALNDYNNGLIKLDIDLNNREAALKQEIADRVNAYYNKEYEKYYNDLKYRDQLKQQAIENNLAQQRINISAKSAPGGSGFDFGSGSGSGSGFDTGTGNTNFDELLGGIKNRDTILQGTYTPKLSTKKAQTWFNKLNNSISSNGFKITYGDLLTQMAGQKLSNADANAVLKSFIRPAGVSTVSKASSKASNNTSTNTDKSKAASAARTSARRVARYASKPLTDTLDMLSLPFNLAFNYLKNKRTSPSSQSSKEKFETNTKKAGINTNTSSNVNKFQKILDSLKINK